MTDSTIAMVIILLVLFCALCALALMLGVARTAGRQMPKPPPRLVHPDPRQEPND